MTTFDGNTIKPYISAYLLIMGIVILAKAFKRKVHKPTGVHTARVSALAVAGGFFDAIGGGGWGPIVATTLVARGKDPRLTIGSVNFSEFFVTLTESIVFIITLQFGEYWQVILGLLLGGALAAPLAARVAKKMPAKALMILVGTLIIVLSVRAIALAVF